VESGYAVAERIFLTTNNKMAGADASFFESLQFPQSGFSSASVPATFFGCLKFLLRIPPFF